MKSRKRVLTIIFAVLTMLFLIIDAKTAATGAAEGIDLCFRVIIPSLFPFIVAATYLNASILGMHIPGFRALGRCLGIPVGGESLLLLGLIGGYPVGAQFIADANKQGYLDRQTAQILLGYCSNAGPAFIFGMAGTLFSSFWISLFLWIVHLLSAIMTGFLLPRPQLTKICWENNSHISIVQALRKSIIVIASVCGWVVIFKTMMAYIERWFISRFAQQYMLLLTGILELSNGCVELTHVEQEAERFIICAVFLAFGGLCIMLQTQSVTEELGLGLYAPGKLMQACISVLITIPLVCTLFPEYEMSSAFVIGTILVCVLMLAGLRIFSEKSCGNSEKYHV